MSVLIGIQDVGKSLTTLLLESLFTHTFGYTFFLHCGKVELSHILAINLLSFGLQTAKSSV